MAPRINLQRPPDLLGDGYTERAPTHATDTGNPLAVLIRTHVRIMVAMLMFHVTPQRPTD